VYDVTFPLISTVAISVGGGVGEGQQTRTFSVSLSPRGRWHIAQAGLSIWQLHTELSYNMYRSKN